MRSAQRMRRCLAINATVGARCVALAVALLGASVTARALPTFASQTGLPCAQCHTVAYGPALTPYGRQFKLNGYVWGDGTPMPLAVMLQGGYTRTAADQPEPPAEHYSVNDNLSLDQASVFFAGRLSNHAGAFVQVTYSGPDRHTSWDNVDLRYARSTTIRNSPVVFGVSVNNNPTVQDLWNSTPAWGFPYISSAIAPTPAAGTLIGALGQTVLGATAYAMVDDHYYVEAGGYRSLPNRWLGNVGLNQDSNSHLRGVAPYWRAAVQFDGARDHISVGTFGLSANVSPAPTLAATDRYTDVGFDATYQVTPTSDHQFASNASYIHEHRSLAASAVGGAASTQSGSLHTTALDFTYSYRRTYAVSAGLFDIGGNADTTLYAPAALGGSASGRPDSRGYIFGAEYIPFGKLESYGKPWLNVRIGLQYVGYTKFNGDSRDYDGAGRDAHDNNTLFAYVWIII